MISSIYHSFDQTLPVEIMAAIEQTIDTRAKACPETRVFFRADDIGVPSANLARMMALFLKYQTPLCLAVVPAWMTQQRWAAMKGFCKQGPSLFCWHMHGFRHKNHELEGKSQEFGPARSSMSVFDDLANGQARLEFLLGSELTPVFTPPWNRCSLDAMIVLKQIGFKAISRSHGSRPDPPGGLADFPVHVDLHTRKETLAQKGWQNLLAEMTCGLQADACGIMIHHMRMNDQAFMLLEYLLALFSMNKRIHTVTYKDLI